MFLQGKPHSSIFLGPYQIVAKIQEGTQSIILMGKNKGKVYGLKLYKNGNIGRKFFQKQIQILFCINNDLIVKPLETYANNDQGVDTSANKIFQPFLVMQYYPNGDLRNFMNLGIIPTKIRNHLILSMARCLESTQINMVIHRDIKPENFLVDSNFNLKLIDFGAAIKQQQINQELVGTSNYIAPQIYKSKNYSYKSDIFAMGVICFQLIMSQKKVFPFKQAKISDSNFLLLKQKMYDRFWAKFMPVNIQPEIKNFLQKILSPNPNERPSASEILTLNCFKETADFQQCQAFWQLVKSSSKNKCFFNCPTF